MFNRNAANSIDLATIIYRWLSKPGPWRTDRCQAAAFAIAAVLQKTSAVQCQRQHPGIAIGTNGIVKGISESDLEVRSEKTALRKFKSDEKFKND